MKKIVCLIPLTLIGFVAGCSGMINTNVPAPEASGYYTQNPNNPVSSYSNGNYGSSAADMGSQGKAKKRGGKGKPHPYSVTPEDEAKYQNLSDTIEKQTQSADSSTSSTSTSSGTTSEMSNPTSNGTAPSQSSSMPQ